MNIVIPMAGRGSRLASDPSGRPKPFIEVHDEPLWLWAARCLPLDMASQIVFVCLQEHVQRFDLLTGIPSRLPNMPVTVVALDEVTDGQLRTVFEAKDSLSLHTSLIVYNADSWFRHCEREFLESMSTCDGALGVAQQDGTNWSFARVDETGFVAEVAEKRRISDFACTGLYYFRETSTFLSDAAETFNESATVNGEYYIAPLYNRMLLRGEHICIVPATDFMPIGTPEELAAFRNFISGDDSPNSETDRD